MQSGIKLVLKFMRFVIKTEAKVDYIGISSSILEYHPESFYMNFDVNPVHTLMDFYRIEICLNCI